jgi:NitT/TauT family transport system substrate-binding protein
VATTPRANVKSAWIGLTANQMLWPLAKEAGYFDKYGITMDLQYVEGSGTAVQSMVGGDLMMIQAAGSAVVSGRAAQQDLVMVAGFQNEIGWKIVAVDGINSVDDLKGKTVAVSRVGNSDYFAWPILAKQKGWRPDDFKYLNANNAPGQITMLQAGNAQATAVSPPNEVLAQSSGSHVVLDTTMLHIPLQQVGMVVSANAIAQNRSTSLNVLRATIEAIHRWKTDPEFTKGVLKKYLQVDDPAFINSGYDSYTSVFLQAPYPTEAGFTEVISEVATQTPAASAVMAAQCMDLSLLKELEDSGFIKQVYGA